MAEPFIFQRSARRFSALLMAATALLFLTLLIFALQAHPAIIAIFAVLISPALWEVFKNSETELVLSDTQLEWRTGGRTGEVLIDQIDRVALRTTFDFSQRATVRLKDGRKLRIPSECLPGGREFDSALEARGVPTTRSLFGG